MEFSDIALAKLLQTAPELGPLILNFQDVSDEVGEDVGCKVGVFILRSGAEVLFVPVVGRGEDVFPIDSIFVDSTKKFIPLTRKTVETAISSGQTEPGRPTTIPKTVTQNPSVQDMINPPRTGKYVYASSSRLVDFLAQLHPRIKQAAYEKIAAERTLYDSLDRMFGLRAIFDVLRQGPEVLSNATPTDPATDTGNSSTPVEVLTVPRAGMRPEVIQSILEEGYYVSGNPPTRRVAMSSQDFNRTGTARQISAVDSDRDWDLAFRSGPSREAFIAPLHRYQGGRRVLALFSNGDYAVADSYVAVGEPLDRKQVLDRLFHNRPPILLRDLSRDQTFVLMTADGEFLGPYSADGVSLTPAGVEVRVGSASPVRSILGYRNFQGRADVNGDNLYVPSNTVVIVLGSNVTSEMDVSVNGASRRAEVEAVQLLGSELNIGFDGVEFSANGKVVGGVPQVMELLVVKEGLNPDQARSFVKQAQETKFVKVYMSKRASSDYSPSEIPQYGEIHEQGGDVAPNGAFMPAVQQATGLGDSQIVEATIISERLQTPDMFAQISEYLPDIEEAVDKLGRIMFMSRVHIHKLGEQIDSDSVFSLLAQIKSVYRLLGENLLRLRRLTTTVQSVAEPIR